MFLSISIPQITHRVDAAIIDRSDLIRDLPSIRSRITVAISQVRGTDGYDSSTEHDTAKT